MSFGKLQVRLKVLMEVLKQVVVDGWLLKGRLWKCVRETSRMEMVLFTFLIFLVSIFIYEIKL